MIATAKFLVTILIDGEVFRQKKKKRKKIGELSMPINVGNDCRQAGEW